MLTTHMMENVHRYEMDPEWGDIRYARLPETDRERRTSEADKEGGEMIKVVKGEEGQITGFTINGSLDQIAEE